MSFVHCNFLGDLELNKKKRMASVSIIFRMETGCLLLLLSPLSITDRSSLTGERELVLKKQIVSPVKQLARGTDFHEVAQDYLLNKELDWNNYLPASKFMFYHLKPELDKINNIHAIERTLYSEYLGLAGRVDCIAEYDGELAVIDFKTSTKIKPEKWIENYFVQEMFYAAAYYELTGIPIKKLITLMVTPGGEVKVFDKRNKGDYIKLLVRYIKEFVSHNTGHHGE